MSEEKLKLPSLEKLLDLEKNARGEGSGIKFDSLTGDWKFKSVWKQGTNKEDSISSTLLQVLCASLELEKDKKNSEDNQFIIANSIKFGLLSLRFSGRANLERRQPLLVFSFNLVELKLVSLTILKSPLKEQENNKRPFFALIALNSSNKWLSARGKGGGLALWVKK